MRRAAVLAAAVVVALAPGRAAAEQLTVAVSTGEIRIDSNFTGANITVFGVIERDASTVSRAANYEVAIVLRGPPESVVAWRKDRVVGIWANRTSETMVSVPSFYGISTSGLLDEVSTPAVLRRFGIGLDYVPLKFRGRKDMDDGREKQFRAAFIRLNQKAGLYSEQFAGVEFMGASVFRSTMWVPANTPDGDYTLTVYLFSGSALLAQREEKVSITKTGFEQVVFTAAHDQALLYGLACVLLALFTGWIAGVVFRRD